MIMGLLASHGTRVQVTTPSADRSISGRKLTLLGLRTPTTMVVCQSNNEEPERTLVAVETHLPELTLDRQKPITGQVYTYLRRLILRVHLKPGEALSEKDLSVKLGLSRTPVREAFIRLADEGLVDIFPQRGTLVAPIRIAEVEEAYFLRRVLEIAVVRRAAESLSKSQVELLSANLRQQSIALKFNDHDMFMDLDEAFHRLLSDIVSLPRAWRVIQGVKGQLDRVRFISLPERGHGKLILRQHEAIFKAVKAGDADRAEREMHDHLHEIWESVERLMRENKDLFQS